MLINFTLTNFRCFRNEATFSMLSGPRFKTHSHALTPLPGWRSKSLLPLAALYGGTASGKSTLVEALKQMKAAVMDGEVPEYTPFELDEVSPSRPTQFCIVILCELDSILVDAFSIRSQKGSFPQRRHTNSPSWTLLSEAFSTTCCAPL